MSRRKITLDEVKTAILAQCDAHPGKRNPVVPGGGAACLYTDTKNESRHCIVGQFLADRELPVPGPACRLGWYSFQKYDGPDPDVPVEGLTPQEYRKLHRSFTLDAHEFLTDVQSYADGEGTSLSPARRWGSVASAVRRGEFD